MSILPTSSSPEFGDEDKNVKSVLIIDSQWIFRKGLKHVMLESTVYRKVFEARDLEAAVKILKDGNTIDLILVTLDFQNTAWGETLKALQLVAAVTPIVAMSNPAKNEDVLSAIALGACGFFSRDDRETEALSIIDAAGSGTVQISRKALTSGGQSSGISTRGNGGGQPNAVDNLTPRQIEVLEAIARGKSNQAIASDLNISEHTTKTHVASILKVLNVKNRTQAALLLPSRL